MKNILVIDDDRLDRRIISSTAAANGFNVIEACDGVSGWELANQTADLSLIVTDVLMPELDGRELVKRIRSNSRLANIPIIIVSSYIKLHEISNLLELGASRFMPKPLQVKHLAEYMNALTQPVSNTQPRCSLDVEAVMARIGNDMGLFKELVGVFIDDTPKRMAILGECVAASDLAGIRLNSHAIKSSLNNIGANEPGKIAFQIEDTATRGQLTGIKELYKRLEVEINALYPELQAFIKADNEQSSIH